MIPQTLRQSTRKRTLAPKALEAKEFNRPIKKAKAVTAGIGRGAEAEGNAGINHGRNVDSHEVSLVFYYIVTIPTWKTSSVPLPLSHLCST